jgi:hypothetical protein
VWVYSEVVSRGKGGGPALLWGLGTFLVLNMCSAPLADRYATTRGILSPDPPGVTLPPLRQALRPHLDVELRWPARAAGRVGLPFRF